MMMMLMWIVIVSYGPGSVKLKYIFGTKGAKQTDRLTHIYRAENKEKLIFYKCTMLIITTHIKTINNFVVVVVRGNRHYNIRQRQWQRRVCGVWGGVIGRCIARGSAGIRRWWAHRGHRGWARAGRFAAHTCTAHIWPNARAPNHRPWNSKLLHSSLCPTHPPKREKERKPQRKVSVCVRERLIDWLIDWLIYKIIWCVCVCGLVKGLGAGVPWMGL